MNCPWCGTEGVVHPDPCPIFTPERYREKLIRDLGGKMKDKAGDSPDCPHCLEAKAAEEEPTGFEKKSLKEVIESWLYTSENMFGEIVFDAGRELQKRLREVVPPPEWAKKK